MKNATLTILVMTILFSCKTSTDSINSNNIFLKLHADRTIGESPLEVNFTGNLSGNIDTLKLFYPPVVLYHGTGKTVIRYAVNDTFVYAKKTYTSKYTYNSAVADTFKAFMLLQGLNRDIVSDTLEIIIQ